MGGGARVRKGAVDEGLPTSFKSEGVAYSLLMCG
jgi:hypothetical protein